MKSYIRIYGPPFLEAIKALEKIAINMPDVYIMHPLIEAFLTTAQTTEPVWANLAMNYFGPAIPRTRRGKIISKSGERMGDYDFYFEWAKDPTMEELHNLIEKIDSAFSLLGCRYTITTK